MMKSSSGWFMGILEKKDTKSLVNCLESVMLRSLEDNPLITREKSVCGFGFVYTINAGQGNIIELVESVTPPSFSSRCKLLVNNIQVDDAIRPDFRRDIIDKIFKMCSNQIDGMRSRQTCIDVLSSWNANI